MVKELGKLTKFLHHELNNGLIYLTSEIVENKDDDKKVSLYTMSDKLAYLQNKFPLINTFIDKFGFELDT